MAVTCGYFNSVDGDRKYNAETMTRYFEGLISNGVYSAVGEKLHVTSGSDLSVNVGTGRAMLECRWLNNSSTLNLTLEPADNRMQRYDAVILQLDLSDNVRDFKIIIRTGENALDSPTKPSVQNLSQIKEMCLAYVYVGAGVSKIRNSDIEDMRGSSVCPWVTGLIEQVDTSTLFTQFNQMYLNMYENWYSEFDELLAAKELEFNNWFNSLTQTLGVNVTLKSYQNIVQTTTEVNEITIGISQYQKNDILQVNINGVIFIKDFEYTVVGEGATAKIKLTNTIKAGNIVTFNVLKSEVGSGSQSTEVTIWDTNQHEKFVKLVRVQGGTTLTSLTTIENAIAQIPSLCSVDYNYDLVLSNAFGWNIPFFVVCDTQTTISSDSIIKVKYRANNTHAVDSLSLFISSDNSSICDGSADSNYVGEFEQILAISTLDNYIEVLLKATTDFTAGNYYLQFNGTAANTQFRIQEITIINN